MEPVDYQHHHSANEGGESAAGGGGVPPPPPQSSHTSKVSRIRLNEVMEGPWTMEKVLDLWEEQDKYIDALEARVRHLGHRRENYLVMRLSSKEQELNDLSLQIRELKRLSGKKSPPSGTSLLDPALNLVLGRLKKELESAKTKMSETQEELSAWKFTPDSVTGKRLMSKCRQLLQENEDIGKMIASGRLSKLEAELAMQKTLAAKMKQNQLEMDEFVQELDEDVEGMQSTIYYLQQQLREAKEKLSSYEKEKEEAAALVASPASEEPQPEDKRPQQQPPPPSSTSRGGRNRKAKDLKETRKREAPTENVHEEPTPATSSSETDSGRPKRRRNAAPPKSDAEASKDTLEEDEHSLNPDAGDKQNIDAET